MIRLALFISIAFIYSVSSYGQKQGNIWYFGIKAGIDFNSNPAIPLVDSQMEQYEGTASIADTQGNLVLYTNGISVWNKNHRIIADGLYGNTSSTQASLIIPHPSLQNLYYIFTTDTWNDFSDTTSTNKGLNYSLVDMSLNQGEGGLIEKNVPLFRPSTEKLTAVLASDCQSIWIISHPFDSDEFWVYKINQQGLNPSPIISSTGRKHITKFNSSGQLKASPNGKKLACAVGGGDFISGGSLELFDFNNETGIISNPVLLSGDVLEAGNPDQYYYGVEFSPDASKLYASYLFRPIQQYDLLDLNAAPIQIGTQGNALQLAPDGKIYGTNANSNSNNLIVINNPNEKGEACNFQLNGFSLKDKITEISLPNFIQSYFLKNISLDFQAKNTCQGQPTHFIASSTTDLIEWQWNFGDPSSGDANTSTIANPNHAYKKSGEYQVQLIASSCYVSDTINKTITITSDPIISFPQDTLSVCINELPVELSIENYPATSYEWHNGLKSNSIQIEKEGWYKLQTQNTCRSHNDSIYVDIIPSTEAFIPNDTIVCDGSFALLDAKNEAAIYLWNTGETTQSIKVDRPGTYWVEITNRCSSIVDTTHLVFIPEDKSAFTSNVFTPNGDGKNDQFVNYVRSTPDYYMQISNRWGKIVFESKDPNHFWDGNYFGQAMETGVYFWFIHTQDCSGKPLQLKGTVTLLR